MSQQKITSVPVSRYHQYIISMALHESKPNTKDRDRMDDWVNMCSAVGNAIMAQGGEFNIQKWMERCYYGPK
jgi:hypothetical protein